MTMPEQVEVKKEETLNQQKEQVVDQKQPENKQEAVQEESEQNKNWKKWKENRQKEREETARIDAARQKAEQEAQALRQALEAVVNKNDRRQNNENSYEEEETEEQRINRKVEEALAKREQQYQAQREQEEIQTYPNKLRNTYSDFNQVCSSENLDYLEYHHPELAKSFAHRKEGFDKWSDIYNAVKRYVPNTNSNRDSIKAEKNLAKPQSLSHSSLSGTGPTGTSHQLTEQRRAENWARMQKTLKGLSN